MTVKRNYKKEVEDLVRAAKRMGYNVRFDWSNRVWRGMNPEAAAWLLKHKEYGKHAGSIPKKTICLNKYSEHNNKLRSQTLRHELVEARDMKCNGHSYPTAHKIACRKQSSIDAVR